MRKVALSVLLAIGVAFIVAPIATGMFGKASAGERVMKSFTPVLTTANVDRSSGYLTVFQGIGKDFAPVMTQDNVARLQRYLGEMSGVQADTERLLPQLAQVMGMTPDQLQSYMANNYTSMMLLLAQLPQMRLDLTGMTSVMAKDIPGFSQIDPALQHFAILLTVMRSNVSDFAKANSLPRMGLLPWFLLIPGIAIVLLSGGLLFDAMRRRPVAIDAGELADRREHIRAA